MMDYWKRSEQIYLFFLISYIVARPTPHSLAKLISFSPLSIFLIISALVLKVLCLRLSEMDMFRTH
jgi:hypothetical protein